MGPLLGPAARPLLLTVIRDLRPDLSPPRVAQAVDRLLARAEQTRDPTVLWRAVRAVLLDLTL